MPVISQREFRDHLGEVLRRAEAGETFTVTVAGRPVAELAPVRQHRWVSGPALTKVWQGPTPRGLEEDLMRLNAELTDPFQQ